LARFIVDDPLPSLHDHYSRFLATTEQSAPLRRIGTFGLAVGAAWAFSLGIAGQVLTSMAFDQSGPRWLGISDLIAEPEGPTFISYKVARSLLNRLRFVTQDPERTWALSRMGAISDSLTCRKVLVLAIEGMVLSLRGRLNATPQVPFSIRRRSSIVAAPRSGTTTR
jgi:hypothetical protein